MCFRKIDWKSDTRHSFSGICREIRTKFHQKFAEKMQNLSRKMKKIRNSIFNREKMLAICGWNFEFEERCKGVNRVDLGESFPTSIYLQKSASIQPRTSPSKFGGKLFNIIIRVLTLDSTGGVRPAGSQPTSNRLPIYLLIPPSPRPSSSK